VYECSEQDGHILSNVRHILSRIVTERIHGGAVSLVSLYFDVVVWLLCNGGDTQSRNL